jgi:hypothetical protein
MVEYFECAFGEGGHFRRMVRVRGEFFDNSAGDGGVEEAGYGRADADGVDQILGWGSL